MVYQPRNTVGAMQGMELPRPSPLAQQEVMGSLPRREHDIYLLSDEEQAESDALLESVYERAPQMRQFGFQVKDSRDQYAVLEDGEESREGRLEFYPPGEMGPPNQPSMGNPYPGHPTMELFKPLTDYNEDVPQSILGDMLHHLPAVDPEFAAMREEFRGTLTKKQVAEDKRSHLNRGETRSFEDWMEFSRLDAYIRGLLYPDRANDWADVYTDTQRELGKKIRKHVERPVEETK